MLVKERPPRAVAPDGCCDARKLTGEWLAVALVPAVDKVDRHAGGAELAQQGLDRGALDHQMTGPHQRATAVILLHQRGAIDVLELERRCPFEIKIEDPAGVLLALRGNSTVRTKQLASGTLMPTSAAGFARASSPAVVTASSAERSAPPRPGRAPATAALEHPIALPADANQGSWRRIAWPPVAAQGRQAPRATTSGSG